MKEILTWWTTDTSSKQITISARCVYSWKISPIARILSCTWIWCSHSISSNRFKKKMIIWVFRGRYERGESPTTTISYDACDDEKSSKQNDRHTKCHHQDIVDSQQRLERRSRKAISRYCKEIVGFESRCLHKHSEGSIADESVSKSKSREVKHDHMHVVRFSGDFSPSLRCVSFVRLRTICGKRKFLFLFFIFSFLYFLTEFSVQLVNSSLTHDVPRGSIADFSFFFLPPLWSQAKWERIKWLLQ